jgi:hypothetical protein
VPLRRIESVSSHGRGILSDPAARRQEAVSVPKAQGGRALDLAGDPMHAAGAAPLAAENRVPPPCQPPPHLPPVS